MRTIHSLVGLAALMLAMSFSACDNQEPYTPLSSFESNSAASKRIVTLAPALTQMVIDLGLGQQIVGVARNDAAAPAQASIVGTYEDIDFERLIELNPTHVLLMTDKDGVPPRLRELEATSGFILAAFPSPDRILDIYALLVTDSITSEDPSVAAALNVMDKGIEVLNDVQNRLDAILDATLPPGTRIPSLSEQKNVLIVIGTNPVMASGPGSVLDELLVKYASANNAAQFATTAAPVYNREQLLALRPDIILMVMPGAAPLRPIDQDPRLAEFRGLDIPAVTENRIVLINHPLAMLPSTSIPEVAAEIAKVIHPNRANGIDAALHRSRFNPDDV